MKYNNGSCLCGQVQFQVKKDIQIAYHCHCSLCRKQSGTGSNAATLVDAQYFEWSSGIELIKTFKKESGFTSCFCTTCGSPVPNKVGSSSFIWIPLGLLNDGLVIQKRLNFCISSRIDWAPPIYVDSEYLELPSEYELKAYFN